MADTPEGVSAVLLQRSVVAAIENGCTDLAQSLLLSLTNGRPLPALFTPPIMEALGISVSTAMDRLMAVAHCAAQRGDQKGSQHAAVLLDAAGEFLSVGWNHRSAVSATAADDDDDRRL